MTTVLRGDFYFHQAAKNHHKPARWSVFNCIERIRAMPMITKALKCSGTLKILVTVYSVEYS